jgi:hypothetical protein
MNAILKIEALKKKMMRVMKTLAMNTIVRTMNHFRNIWTESDLLVDFIVRIS